MAIKEYVDHSSTLFKFYVLGVKVFYAVKISANNLYDSSINFHLRCRSSTSNWKTSTACLDLNKMMTSQPHQDQQTRVVYVLSALILRYPPTPIQFGLKEYMEQIEKHI